VWRDSKAPEKKFLQGLIQVAVAFHHHSTGNFVGARSLLERARKNLLEYPGDFGGIELSALLHSISAWREAIGSGVEVPEFPKLKELKVKESSHEGHEVTRRKT
jgi:predicted metal-dependent hydrolase